MGEKIRVINSSNQLFEVELNKSTYTGGPQYIHIQNERFRFCITESEFIQLAISIRKAGQIFKNNKQIRED